jgi:hypothetical protein
MFDWILKIKSLVFIVLFSNRNISLSYTLISTPSLKLKLVLSRSLTNSTRCVHTFFLLSSKARYFISDVLIFCFIYGDKMLLLLVF